MFVSAYGSNRRYLPKNILKNQTFLRNPCHFADIPMFMTLTICEFVRLAGSIHSLYNFQFVVITQCLLLYFRKLRDIELIFVRNECTLIDAKLRVEVCTREVQ